MEDLPCGFATWCGIGEARECFLRFPRHKSKSSDTLTVFFRITAADANRSAGQAIWLASGCWENQGRTTVTSNRRLSGVRKVIVFVRMKRGGNYKNQLGRYFQGEWRPADSISLKIDTDLNAVWRS